MTGLAVLAFIGAMGAGWLTRALLLRAIGSSHPAEYAALGRPTSRQLASLLPRYREMQLAFWKYLWSRRVMGLDRRVSALAWAVRASDIALAASMVLVFWTAGRPG